MAMKWGQKPDGTMGVIDDVQAAVPVYGPVLGQTSVVQPQEGLSSMLNSVSTPTYSNTGISNSMDVGYLQKNVSNLGLPQMSSEELATYKLKNPGSDINIGTAGSGVQSDKDTGIDWGMKGYGGVALGAGQLGLGLASYLQQSGVADKQKELMGQQIANNRAEMANKTAYRKALSGGSMIK